MAILFRRAFLALLGVLSLGQRSAQPAHRTQQLRQRDALALEVADAVALVAEGLAVAAALQPTTPAMAASDRPPRKARRVTSE